MMRMFIFFSSFSLCSSTSEVGSTTNNLERQKQAAFSDTIFVVGTRLLVKKGGPIKESAVLQ
jgi:glutamate/aspartate transport system substrate-binding protein